MKTQKTHTKAYERLMGRDTPRKVVDKATLRLAAKKLRSLRHEEHFNQGRWMIRTACGTAACIAGHICLAKGLTVEEIYHIAYEISSDMPELLSNELGLPRTLCGDLFHPTSRFWPEPYKSDFQNATISYGIWRDTRNKGRYRGKRPSRIAADLLDAIADKKVLFNDYGFYRFAEEEQI